MELKMKKELILEALKEKKLLNIFEAEEEEDSLVLYGKLPIGNSNETCLVNLDFGNGIYDSIRYNICELNYEEKRDEVIKLLNEFNKNNKVLKFSLNKNNHIYGQLSYISDELFDPDTVINLLINVFIYIVEELYPKIMKVLWS